MFHSEGAQRRISEWSIDRYYRDWTDCRTYEFPLAARTASLETGQEGLFNILVCDFRSIITWFLRRAGRFELVLEVLGIVYADVRSRVLAETKARGGSESDIQQAGK